MSHFHTLTVREIRRETHDSVSLLLEVPANLTDGYRFQPGQYLTLRQNIDGADVRRSYSICSAPEDGELRVAIKKVPGGAFSSFANHTLKPGDSIDVMPPEGRFTPRAQVAGPGRHCLGVAAGSGITPILSIMKTVLALHPDNRFTLIYGNRTAANTMFIEAIEDLKNRFLGRLSVVYVFSKEHQDIQWVNGRIDAEKIGLLAEKLVDIAELDEAFICGPLEMTEAVRPALVTRGLAADHIRSELFSTAGAQPKLAVAAADRPVGDVTVEVRLDGRTTQFALEAGEVGVLNAAARAGLDLPSSCQGGMCCTCRAQLVEGEAEMALNYSLEQWEVDAGYILACQCLPKSKKLVLDFDTA